MSEQIYPVNDYLLDRWVLQQLKHELKHALSAAHIELKFFGPAIIAQDDARSAYLQAARIQFVLGLNSDDLKEMR